MSQAYLGQQGVSDGQPYLRAQQNHRRHDNVQDSNLTPKIHHHHHVPHDAIYYRNCLMGGVLSSSLRWLLTPLDSIKCNMQVHPQKYPSFVGGLQLMFRQEGIRGLFRGFIPTVFSYSSQSGTKYMMYEFNKDHLNEWAGPDNADRYKSLIYITSAGCAEAIADILMCPWETLKVQMQTTSTHHPRLMPAVVALSQQPHQLAGALPPLWGRQIAGTMANFFTFEHSANFIYHNVLQGVKEDHSTATQLGVTFCAGYASGLVSTVVSHPADSLISLKARYPESTMRQLIQKVGWRDLATKGLGARIGMTGSIIAFQWFVYDSFKTFMGMGTTGG